MGFQFSYFRQKNVQSIFIASFGFILLTESLANAGAKNRPQDNHSAFSSSSGTRSLDLAVQNPGLLPVITDVNPRPRSRSRSLRNRLKDLKSAGSDWIDESSFALNRDQIKTNFNFLTRSDRFTPTAQRLFGLGATLAFGGGMSALEYFYGNSLSGAWSSFFGATVVMNGFETALGLAAMVLSQPPLLDEAASTKEQIRSTAVTIPIYGRNKDLRPTIHSLITQSTFQGKEAGERGILPEQIFVGENTSSYKVFYVTPDCKNVVFNSFTAEMMLLDPKAQYDRISDNYKRGSEADKANPGYYRDFVKDGKSIYREAFEAIRKRAEDRRESLTSEQIKDGIPEWIRTHPKDFGRAILTIEEAQRILHDPSPNNQYRDIHYYYNETGTGKVGTEYLLTFLASLEKRQKLNPQTGNVEEVKKYIYSIATDDDIQVSTFDPGLNMIYTRNEDYHQSSANKYGLLMYPIEPSNEYSNWIITRQKYEYQSSDMHKYFQLRMAGTVLAPHGAISASAIDTYLHVMKYHTGEFNAEDARKGFVYRRAGHNIGICPLVHPVGTTVPKEVHEYWGQRVNSWLPGSELLLKESTKQLIGVCGANRIKCDLPNLVSTSVIKLYEFQAIFSLVSSWIRPFILYGLTQEDTFWISVGAIWAITTFQSFLYENVFSPIQRNQDIPGAGQLTKSLASHTLNLPFVLLNSFQSMFGTYVAWVGAGAGDPKNYPIMLPFPKQMGQILKNEALLEGERRALLKEFQESVLHNARDVNFSDRNLFQCGEENTWL